jgi:hypothetical protein
MLRAISIAVAAGVVLAIIAYLLFTAYWGGAVKPENQVAPLNLSILRSAVLQYKIQNGKYPSSLEELVAFNSAVKTNLSQAGNAVTYVPPAQDAAETTPGIILFYYKRSDGMYAVIDLDGKTSTAAEPELNVRLHK